MLKGQQHGRLHGFTAFITRQLTIIVAVIFNNEQSKALTSEQLIHET